MAAGSTASPIGTATGSSSTQAAGIGTGASLGSGTSGGIGSSTGTSKLSGQTAQATEKLRESASGVASTVKQYAGDLTGRAKDKGRTVFEQQKGTALDQVGKVAQAIRSTASTLESDGQGKTAQYVNVLADQLESLGGRLGQKDLDTLLQDAQSLARRAPATLIVGSIVTGFLLARFLKSSSERQYGLQDSSELSRDTIVAGEAGPYAGAADISPAVSPNIGASGISGATVNTPGSSASAGLNGQKGSGNLL